MIAAAKPRDFNHTARLVTVQQQIARQAHRMRELDRGHLLMLITGVMQWADLMDLSTNDVVRIAAAATRMAELDAEEAAR